jgi:hypothetical protein
MSFYTCDTCKQKVSYKPNESKATYEIEQLDLCFCCYTCLENYFKRG